MAYVKARSFSEELVSQAAAELGTSTTRISMAQTVRDYAPELIDSIVSGFMGLDQAWNAAKQRRHMTKGQVAMAVVKMRLLESKTIQDESALDAKSDASSST